MIDGAIGIRIDIIDTDIDALALASSGSASAGPLGLNAVRSI